MIEDNEETVKKVIISAVRNALRIFELNWRSEVYRTSRNTIDCYPVWGVDFFDKDNNLKTITFESPPYLVDETWYTKKIVEMIEQLITN